MAKSLNRVTIIGNLGRDPELRSTPQGRHVTTLSLATSEKYKNKENEWKEVTDWHRIVMWDRLAEIACEYLRKGNKVYVEGNLKTRNYEDKNGITRHVTEVLASNMVMMNVQFNKEHSDKHNYDDEESSESNKYDEDDNDSGENGDFPF